MTSVCPPSEIINEIRIQPLSPYLVRIEQKGPAGFEDQFTFTVVNRAVQKNSAEFIRGKDGVALALGGCRVTVPFGAASYEAVCIETSDGARHGLCPSDLAPGWMPSPSALPAFWILPDSPRVVPPPRGALPPPASCRDPYSEWNITNDAPDFYVFFPAASGYARFREDFLRLTGPIPVPPLYAFGLWYSRYYPYSETGAMEVMDRFRRANIPLDVFVADTDWRVGASCGYAVNTNLFPDMQRFIRRAHEKQVRVMFNDHPEPKGPHALAPEELRYRCGGLRFLLDMDADIWWFDRNWHTHLQEPAKGLHKEVWGMRLYHDVTQAARPERRPLIMSNADGINNGHMETPSHPAAHRYPIWWTGDTVAEWNYLSLGVQNGVDAGIVSLLPYVHEDLTGHHGQPDPELYVRFMQFGALSPIARIHCTTGVTRYPWNYGPIIERITGDYIRLRYRLLPMIYAAAYRASADGTPLLRRGDLEWPRIPEAHDNTQYLFGDDLLVAPIMSPAAEYQPSRRSVWIPEGEWMDLWNGMTVHGPATMTAEAKLHQVPMYVRRGGVLLSAPQAYHVSRACWEHVVVDAFVPAGDTQTVRRLMEDDGLSAGPRASAPSVTELTFHRSGSNISLSIAASGPAENRPEAREWTVRIHLPADEKLQTATCNGKKPDAKHYTVLTPASEPPHELFTGAGAPPPPAAGPVVEIGPVRDSGTALEFELVIL